MAVTELLVPCMSVFALAAIDDTTLPEPVTAQPEEVLETEPVVLAQMSADDLNAAQIEEPEEGDDTAGMESPYSAEIQPLTVPTVEDSYDIPQSGPLVFEDRSDEEVFSMATAYLQDVSTLSANFIQTAPSGNVSTGKLQLSRPGRLRFEYDAPSPTLIVATQGLVYVHDADLETTDSYPVNRTPLKFLLNREVKTDDAVLREVLRAERSVNFILESTDEETQGELILTFDAPELKLRRWAVVDESGNYTVVDLDNVEEGARISNSAFRIPDSGGSFTRDR